MTEKDKLIAELGETKKALQENERNYKTLVENTGDFIFMIGTSGEMLFVNRAAAKLFRKKPVEVVGRKVFELFPKKMATHYLQDLKKLFTSGKSQVSESELVAGNVKMWISTSLTPVKDRNGNVVAIWGVTRDITKMKELQELLRKSNEAIARISMKKDERIRELSELGEEREASEAKYKAFFDGARDGILTADLKTKKFVFANRSICKLIGYSKKELLNLGVLDIHPKKDLPYVLDQFKKQGEGQISIAKDIPVLRKDKSVVYCDVNSAPARINGRDLMLGFFRDVTGRREVEAKLKEMHELLRKSNEAIARISLEKDERIKKLEKQVKKSGGKSK